MTSTVTPLTPLSAFWSSIDPARNSCSPGAWLGLPAMRTMRLSAPRTGIETATTAASATNPDRRRRTREVVCMVCILLIPGRKSISFSRAASQPRDQAGGGDEERRRGTESEQQDEARDRDAQRNDADERLP